MVRDQIDALWKYLDTGKILEEAGLYPIQRYIARRRQKLVDYAVADS